MQRTKFDPGSEALYYGFVSSNGADGINGADGQHGMPGGTGAPGTPGTNAIPPTNGTNAREMRVVLSRVKLPGGMGVHAHCVTPSNTPPKQQWLLQQDDMILLQARGGAGGNGGAGGDGGDGGRGMDGVSSNEHQSGTRGGSGGPGGNGGNGTCGGNGGTGGYIEIEVEEKDMDLLMPIHWDANGGEGGKAGSNGRGGTGGPGGYGGKGSGPRGMSGFHGNAMLTDGLAGKPGSARVQVHFESTRELGARHGFYTSRYFWSLVDFDVTDENQDGIFEPGEHIFIQNIRIQNIGGMPTPTKTLMPIDLIPNEWFEPVQGGQVFIPPGIEPGKIVTLKGRLQARIKYPVEPWETPFNAKTMIRFQATLPGLNSRVIRDFAGQREIELGYPVHIENLRFANAVLPGTKSTFIWKVTNKSTRAMGAYSEQQRSVEITFQSDQKAALQFPELQIHGSNGNQKQTVINNINPGESITLVEEVSFASNAQLYQQHNFEVMLCLGKHGQTHNEVAQAAKPVVQIAAPYEHVPQASLLVVVNCNTRKEQVDAWDTLLTESLGLNCYNVWNVSLYGGYNLPTDASNVLDRYRGKGIVLFGNDFDFFQQGNRNAADMIAPEAAYALATRSTNFLVVGGRSASVGLWWEQVVFPQFGGAATPYQSKKKMMKGLKLAGLLKAGIATPFVASRVPKTKGTFEKQTKKTTKMVKTKFPLERFQICPSQVDPNTICVKQGLPVSCKLLACKQMQDVDGTNLDNLDLLAVLSALPIQERINYAIASAQGTINKAGIQVSVSDVLVTELVKISIIRELEAEIQRYLHEAPWPHHLTTSTCDQHLKSLHTFLNSWPQQQGVASLDPTVADGIIDIFSHLIRSVQLQTLGEKGFRFCHRRTNLRKYLLRKLKEFLVKNSGDKDAVEHFKMAKEAAADKLKFTPTGTRISNNTRVNAGEYNNRWTDSSSEANIVTDAGQTARLRDAYGNRRLRLNSDADASQYVLRDLVAPYPGIMELGILTSNAGGNNAPIPISPIGGSAPGYPQSPGSPVPPYPASPVLSEAPSYPFPPVAGQAPVQVSEAPVNPFISPIGSPVPAELPSPVGSPVPAELPSPVGSPAPVELVSPIGSPVPFNSGPMHSQGGYRQPGVVELL